MLFGLCSFTTIILPLIFSIPSTYFPVIFAMSPAFEPQAISDQKNDWIQTFGNDTTNLKSNNTDLLEVDYLSDGKSLKATLWLSSDSQNASIYDQPSRSVSYGMLVKIGSYNINTGFNGADYNYHIESVNGKWSEYLYQLSSTGSQILLDSKTNYTEPFGGPNIGPGYVKLNLNLSSVYSPSKYGILFYSTESSNISEVSDFTDWVGVPSSSMTMVTSPKDIVIGQGDELLVPANILSTFSNNVTELSFNRGSNDTGSEYNSSGLHVSVERIQPPLFKINVSPQTPIGIYTIPFTATLFIETTIESEGASSTHSEIEFNNPQLQKSKEYPTYGYVTNPSMNLTVTVTPPISYDEKFKEFWSIYGQPISIIAGGFAGGFASLVFAKFRKTDEQSKDTKS